MRRFSSNLGGADVENMLEGLAVQKTIHVPGMVRLDALAYPLSGAHNMGENQNIHRICMTGGPCAGKTTAIAEIKQDLTQLGSKVLVVPEAATILMKGGAMIVSTGFTEAQGLIF